MNFLHMSIEKTTTKMTDTATGTPIMAAGIMLSSFCVECGTPGIAVVTVMSVVCIEVDISTSNNNNNNNNNNLICAKKTSVA